MTALLLCCDSTYAAAREWQLYLLHAAGPGPSSQRAGLAQSHSYESSMPQLPGRTLALRHVHPAPQKMTPDDTATIVPALPATALHRTCEESPRWMSSRPLALARP